MLKKKKDLNSEDGRGSLRKKPGACGIWVRDITSVTGTLL